MDPRQAFTDALKDKKKVLIILQWLVVIITSYLSLFNKGEVVDDPRVYGLVGALLLSVLLLGRLPQSLFEHRYFPHGLVILDTILIGCGIGLNRDSPWDLFLLFFFAIFIAAIGETLIQIVGTCLVMSVLFIIATEVHGKGLSQIGWDALVRVPFVLGVSILYGYMADQTKREKKRIREEGDRIKSEFLSVMSHELRTPLNIVMNYAGMMQKGLFGDLNAEQQRALEKVVKHSHELLAMINDILEITRLGAEAVKLERHKLDLGNFLEDVRVSYDTHLNQDVKLLWDYPAQLPVLETDAGKLKHILWNLINNALKFTDKGHVTVSARVLPESNTVQFKVSDTGIGIPKNELSSIFEIFHQSDGSSGRTYGGVGLGLHVVKRFTEMLGGSVTVESEENRGSIFTVTLPYNA